MKCAGDLPLGRNGRTAIRRWILAASLLALLVSSAAAGQMTISPTSATLTANQTQQFSTTGAGSQVVWTVNGIQGGNATVGTISGTGLYTAPATVTATSTVTIAVSKHGDSAASSVTLNPTVVSVTPGTAAVSAAQTLQFTATESGGTAPIMWSLNPQVGSISSSGVYTAPASVSATQGIEVIATPTGGVAGSAALTVSPAVAVSISPTTVNLTANQTQQFTASVTGTTNTGVTWTLNPAVGNLVTSGNTAVYTAPSTISSNQTVEVDAISMADSTKIAKAVVSLVMAVAVTVAPVSVTLTPSQTQQFTATVSGSTNSSVTWSLNPPVGSISSSGLYTAPSSISSQQTVQATATSTADATKSASAVITLNLPASSGTATEEFVGPFASWANAETQYGAAGDGVTDDTVALQRALNDLGTAGHASVLYLPAGTYRITATLNMTSQIWVSVIGADPSLVTIRWDGPSGGIMLLANGVRYSHWSRITWDGAGRALTAVHHLWDGVVPGASTGNEHTDEVFKGVSFGLRAGTISTSAMDAEVMVVRCKFMGCSQAGISIESWNALDWWIWYSDFEGCNIGVTNQFGAGNFHVYNSNFIGSTYADMTIANTSYFSVRGNFSSGSNMFHYSGGGSQNSAQLTFQNNTVLNTVDPAAIKDAGNLGPLMLFNNTFRSLSTTTPSVQELMRTGVEYLSLGNTYTVSPSILFSDWTGCGSDCILPRGELQDDQTVTAAQITAAAPALPATPPNLNRTVFDVPAGSSASVIQQAITQAAALQGQKPVVHLPVGSYYIAQTLLVPSGADMQIIGDGQGTRLYWSGTGTGPILRLAGPSHATVRELSLQGQNAGDGIVIDNADQPGSRVYGEELYLNGSFQYNVLTDHLNSTLVEMRGLVNNGSGVNNVQVVGGDTPDTGRVNLFGGASGAYSSNTVIYNVTNGGKLLVEDVWYEGAAQRLLNLTDRGTVTLQGSRIAPNSPQGVPAIATNGFTGQLTVSGASTTSTFAFANGANTDILLLGIEGPSTTFVTRDASVTNYALLNSHYYNPSSGSYPIPNDGSASADFMRNMFSQVRTERPSALDSLGSQVTDVRLYRVAVEQSGTGLRVMHNSLQ